MLVTASPSDGPTLMRKVLKDSASLGESTLHTAVAQRVSRAPLAVARMLAERYPVESGMNYIPALSWIHTLKLAALTHDESLRAKVLRQEQPWPAGGQPLFGERVALNSDAG